MGHRQTEACRSSIVEYINRIVVEAKHICEGLERYGQCVKRVGVLPLDRHFGESKTRKVWCDYSVAISKVRNEFAKHERRSREPVQQDNYWRIRFARCSVENLHTVRFNLMNGCQRYCEHCILWVSVAFCLVHRKNLIHRT